MPRRASRSQPPPQLLAVGRILRPHGVRGDLLLEVLTDYPAHLSEVETVYVGEDAEPHTLESARFHRQQLLIKLTGCSDRAAADAFRGRMVYVALDDAEPLRPRQYYQHQILGLAVVSDEGEDLGAVVQILQTGANDVYVVAAPSGELLLPAIDSVIKKIDLDAGKITVHLLDGLR